MKRSDLQKLDEHVRNAHTSIGQLEDMAVRLQLQAAPARHTDAKEYLAMLGLRTMIGDVQRYTRAACEVLDAVEKAKGD